MEALTKPLCEIKREAMGKTWTIEVWPDDAMTEDGGRAYATSNYGEQVVRMNANRPPDGRDGSLLHEIVHFVNKDAAQDWDEATVERISGILYGFLRGFGLWQPFPWPDKDDKEP
jgi:hypothetical protein